MKLKKKKLWYVEEHSPADKSFMIYGETALEVDYDDVDHEEQDRIASKIAAILNDHWHDYD
jgi:hypothetical protein